MKVLYQGKEIELEEATDEEMTLDYINPEDDLTNLEDTLEFQPEEILDEIETIEDDQHE